MLQILFSFTISFLIGTLIGMEREHSHAEKLQPIGIRTFILFALLGTLVATLNQLIFTLLVTIFVFCLILLGYFRSTSRITKKIDLGVTTEISAGIVYCVGYMIPFMPLLSIVISSIVLLVLVERQRLHVLAKKKFKPHEIEAVIVLIVFTLGILPTLPAHAIDASGFFNPRNFGILIATIALMQFGGYIAIRLFGEKIGIALTGFLGGFVSSTVVIATLPRTLRAHPACSPAIMASAILANMAMLIEVMIITLVASPEFFIHVCKPLLTMVAVSLLATGLLLHFKKIKSHPAPVLTNPLNYLSILATSIFIAFMLILIGLAKKYVGTKAILVVSFLGGLFEIHGISLATPLLYLQNQLSMTNAAMVLYVAILATYVSKFILLWSLNPAKFALKTSFIFLLILLSGVLGMIYL